MTDNEYVEDLEQQLIQVRTAANNAFCVQESLLGVFRRGIVSDVDTRTHLNTLLKENIPELLVSLARLKLRIETEIRKNGGDV